MGSITVEGEEEEEELQCSRRRRRKGEEEDDVMGCSLRFQEIKKR